MTRQRLIGWTLAAAFLVLPGAVFATAIAQERSLPVGKVVSFRQGRGAWGQRISPAQSRPETVLTRNDDRDDPAHAPGYCTLGLGGTITIEYPEGFANGAGPDIAVVEKTWGVPGIPETARVEVSQDGRNFVSVGYADNSAATSSTPNTESLMDMSGGPSLARFVKVTDVGSPARGEFANGFDLESVRVLHPAR